MVTTKMKSDEARQSWRDILDKVYPSEDAVVIERYSKPTAVIIGYEYWQALQRQKRMILTDQALAAMEAGNFTTDTELEAGLKERGLL